MRLLAVVGAILLVVNVPQPPPIDWQLQHSGVKARLRGVSAVSSRVGWASGTGGTILRTTDGGASWQAVGMPGAEKLDFRDVDALSADVAHVLSIGPGEASRIYMTTDGGATWSLQLANKDPKVFLDAMTFRNPDNGLAFSDSVEGRFVLFSTANGGRSWERLPGDALPPALDGEGAYAASGTNIATHGPSHSWIGTTASRVLRTADGGRTWQVSQTPLATGPSAGIFSIAFRDRSHGVVVGGDYRKETEAVHNVATTSDGGATWALVTARGLSGFRSAVAFVPGTTSSLLAVGPSGADWSDDGGRTWTPVAGEGFDTVSFAPGTAVGWAAGQGGRIARMTRAR